MSSEFQRIMGGASDPPPLRERGVPSCGWGADSREIRPRCPIRGMRNAMVAAKGRSGNVGECLAWISFCFGTLSLIAPSGF
jgi:hypothetical protein